MVHGGYRSGIAGIACGVFSLTVLYFDPACEGKKLVILVTSNACSLGLPKPLQMEESIYITETTTCLNYFSAMKVYCMFLLGDLCQSCSEQSSVLMSTGKMSVSWQPLFHCQAYQLSSFPSQLNHLL